MRVGKWLGVGRVIAPLALAAVVFAADDISKMAAKDVLKKAAANMDAQAGYHFAMNASLEGMGGGLKAEGIYVKPDTYYMKADTGLEMYTKGRKTMAKDPVSGKWLDSSAFKDPTVVAAIGAAANFNPPAIVANLGRAAVAKYRNDEKLGDVDCKVIEVPGGPEDVKRLVDQATSNWPGGYKVNLSSFIDPQKSKSTYVAWVGKDDLLVHKVTIEIDAEMKKNPQIPIPAVKENTTIEFSKYGKELDLNAPDEVKKGLGLR